MIFGMAPLTFVHVAMSLVGIASGFVVLWGLLTTRRLDCDLFGEYRRNERYGLLLSVRACSAVPCAGHQLHRGAGDSDCGPLPASLGRRLASDLCGERRDCTVPQLLRLNRAIVPENFCPA